MRMWVRAYDVNEGERIAVKSSSCASECFIKQMTINYFECAYYYY
jgi:hypothetical protein